MNALHGSLVSTAKPLFTLFTGFAGACFSPRSALVALVTLVASLALGGCASYSMMDFHRETLDDIARAGLDCQDGALTVRDDTPEGFVVGDDRSAGRYHVTACENEADYVCVRSRHSNASQTSECHRFGEERPDVHLGPLTF